MIEAPEAPLTDRVPNNPAAVASGILKLRLLLVFLLLLTIGFFLLFLVFVLLLEERDRDLEGFLTKRYFPDLRTRVL